MNAGESAVLLRGWEVTSDGESVVARLLGVDAVFEPLGNKEGNWHNADPVGSGEPIGSPTSLVSFTTDKRTTVDILLGSQGVERPTGDPGASLVRIDLYPQEHVLLDGRCWYRLPDRTARAGLWRRKPGRQ